VPKQYHSNKDIMFSFNSHSQAAQPERKIGYAKRGAFTLIEVMISLGVIVITMGGVYTAMLTLNRMAASTRALNAAQTICEQFINQAQKVAYNPQYTNTSGVYTLSNPTDIPLILQTTTAVTTAPSSFPQGYAPPANTAPFDIDQNTANGVDCEFTLQTNEYTAGQTIPAWVFSNVTPIGSQGLLSVRFVVCFQYRSRLYSVQLDTIRAPDSVRVTLK